MIDVVVDWSFDRLVELCDSGKWNDCRECEPNSGDFDKEFLVKFIDLVKSGSYEKSLELKIKQGCDECISKMDEFCDLMKDMLICCLEDECSGEYNQLICNICNSLDAISSELDTKEYDVKLYSEIEDLIIRWNNDGRKTAGALTRQIMKLIKF